MSDEYYYDINLQVFENEGGRFVYSVVQEADVTGNEYEVLASGSADTAAEAIKEAVNTLTDHVKDI